MSLAKHDQTLLLQQAVHETIATRTPLKIVGGNSKVFFGRESDGQLLNVSKHQGIINYHGNRCPFNFSISYMLILMFYPAAMQ